MVPFQHAEIQEQRAAMAEQRAESLATEKRVEHLYSEIQNIRGGWRGLAVESRIRYPSCAREC